MKHKAIKLFLIGLLINPLLINIIGFISPFFGSLILNDPEKSPYLLHLFQAYFPFVSLIFVAAIYHLLKIDTRTWLKVICALVSVIYILSSVYGFMPRGEYLHSIASIAYHSMQAVLLFLAGLILLKNSQDV